MSILCIIPARANSKRLPGKNWEKVGGKTLLARAGACAPDVRRLMFLTDPEGHAREPAVSTDYIVPPELLRDGTLMTELVRWACAEPTVRADNRRFGDPSAVLLLQPTSPFRTVDDVTKCLDIFERTGCDSVVSVTYDLATKGYRRNGAIYLTRWELAARGELMGGWTQFYVMPPERSIDINTAEDLAEARRLAGDS